jgi:hypothetical protein
VPMKKAKPFILILIWITAILPYFMFFFENGVEAFVVMLALFCFWSILVCFLGVLNFDKTKYTLTIIASAVITLIPIYVLSSLLYSKSILNLLKIILH